MSYHVIVLRSLGEHGRHGGWGWGVGRITACHYWAVGQSPGASPCLGLLSFFQKSLPALLNLMRLWFWVWLTQGVHPSLYACSMLAEYLNVDTLLKWHQGGRPSPNLVGHPGQLQIIWKVPTTRLNGREKVARSLRRITKPNVGTRSRVLFGNWLWFNSSGCVNDLLHPYWVLPLI